MEIAHPQLWAHGGSANDADDYGGPMASGQGREGTVKRPFGQDKA